jgi:hypothetical protein
MCNIGQSFKHRMVGFHAVNEYIVHATSGLSHERCQHFTKKLQYEEQIKTKVARSTCDFQEL